MTICDLLNISTQNDATLLQQLRQQITWLIVNGQVKAGEQLPSIHVMAECLGINLHTVRSAYKKLEADGLVESRQGRGTHVLLFDLSQFTRTTTSNRSHTIGVIIPSWVNPFYHAFLQGIEAITEQDQTLLLLCNTHDDPRTALRDFARLSAKQVDGILIASHDISEELNPDNGFGGHPPAMPFVTVDWPGCRGYAVQIDLESAGFQATEHLIKHGHQRIGLITVLSDAPNVLAVNTGYERALKASRIPVDPSSIIQVLGFDLEHGSEGAHRLMDMHDPPTAIFTIADTLALGAMQAVKQTGRRIPEDIALVSFNDIPSAALVEPTLTTVSAPAVQMGREAMKMLQLLINGKQPKKRVINLPTNLVIRHSCGDHPAI